MVYPETTSDALARFFSRLEESAPNAVFMPYLGVWDGAGRKVHMFDLIMERRTRKRIIGIALYDDVPTEQRAESYHPRYHYDVEAIRERDAYDEGFWHGLLEYEGGEIRWSDVRVIGNVFEHIHLLRAAGVDLPTAEILRILALPGPRRWGSLNRNSDSDTDPTDETNAFE
jgi:hypothetical protein